MQNPSISLADIMDEDWKIFFHGNNSNITIGKQLVGLLNRKYAPQLLDISSIKFLVVPLQDKTDLEDRLFKFYGEDRNYYVAKLDKLSDLKKVNLNAGNLVVYENNNYKPLIYITNERETIYKNLSFQPVIYRIDTASQYELQIKNLSKAVYLDFSESYHPNWKLRVGNFNWFDVLSKKNYFVQDANHIKNDAGLNSFYVNPEIVCKQYNCTKNSDGSFNFSATLYFEPQSEMYLGLVISGATLVVAVGYLILTFGRREYVRKNN
jgi:hypothetical protein